MGRNLPAKKYTKSNPTVTRLSFEGTGSNAHFIDIASALSAINRKFYRQGLYYYVNSVEVYNNEQAVYDLFTVPDNWVTKNAHQRGFKLWMKMNNLVAPPLANGVTPKYHDFKVLMNITHATSGNMKPVLYGYNGANEQITCDDWVYSEFVSADDDGDTSIDGSHQEADNFTVHMIGGHQGTPDNWDSVGLIKSYAESRARPNATEPNTDSQLSTDPLINVFDFSSEEQMNDILVNLAEDNDAPPYDLNTYTGELANSLHHVARIGTEVGLGRVGRASGFCAPFGLVLIDPQDSSTAWRLVVNLAVGTYHGVYAERA